MIAQPEAEVPVAHRRCTQEVVGLDQNLHRQPGRQDFHQRRILDRAQLARVDADEVVGEERQRLRVEPVLAEALEEGLVLRFPVFAGDLEFGHGDGLGERDQPGEALAVGGQRADAAVEHE